MSEIVGYARISTHKQNLKMQLDALAGAGCARIFQDTASGAARRPGLDQALAYLRTGDTLLVWKLDRLGRNMRGLIDLSNDLDQRGVHLRSLTDGIDTSTPAGRLFFHMIASVAEMERELIMERTRAGRAAARAAGRFGGRPRADISKKAIETARQSLAAGADMPSIARQLGISLRTAYRRLPVAIRQIDFIEREKANAANRQRE